MPSVSNYAPPSRNPADNDSLAGLLKLALTKFLQKTDDMLPAQVIAYNAAQNVAQVQPIIEVVSTSNQVMPRAQIASVPVLQLSGGGFALRFPVSPGDLGWVKANDRDISLFKQTYSQSPPNTQRKHSFEDAIFIPQAAWNLITLASEDTGNMVLQNYAGTVKISLSGDTVTVNAPNVVITGTTAVTITSPTLAVNGDMIITGTLVTDGNITGNGINLNTHVHSGVTTGGSDTGGPV